jgi:hypothetical protein
VGDFVVVVRAVAGARGVAAEEARADRAATVGVAAMAVEGVAEVVVAEEAAGVAAAMAGTGPAR